MEKLNDVHQQFAEFFPDKHLHPYYYLLSKKLADGHICIPVTEVGFEILPEGYVAGLNEKQLTAEENISGEEATHPIILVNGKLYLQRYFKYETFILGKIREMIAVEKNFKAREEILLQHKNFIQEIFRNSLRGKVDWQLAAALSAVLNNFTIITGGPGTGKTTTVAKALAIYLKLQPSGLRIALAAPTGKAAGRMAESLKNSAKNFDKSTQEVFESLKPFTIHRLLQTKRGTHYFKFNAENPLPYDIIIADESSMLDVALFAKFLIALPKDCRLILLGDKNQLAAVEAGSLFGDLCQAQDCLNVFSEERATFLNQFTSPGDLPFPVNENKKTADHILFEHVIELQHSHRFSSGEGIGKLSEAVINNEQDILKNFLGKKDLQVMITEDDNKKLFEKFISGYKAYIEEKDKNEALKKLNNLRVLCAVREGHEGVYEVNRSIELYLQKKGLLKPTGVFYENRPVMVSENNYELGLFNGDMGITRIDENGTLKVWFENADGTLKNVLAAYLSSADTAFAMTIHKSQGSEFDEVYIILPRQEENKFLSRELLYTGITRAKKHVTINTTVSILLQASAAKLKRSSGITDRLAQNFPSSKV